MARGINLEFLDFSIKPEDDFYLFVNGGWIRKTEIPLDRSSWGSFHELAKNTDEKTLDILAPNDKNGSEENNKALLLFETGMAQDVIENKKLEALEPIFFDIKTVGITLNISSLLGSLISNGLGGIINISVHPDLGDSHIYSTYLEPGGLGLPDKEFYLDETERDVEIRNHYLLYIKRLLQAEKKYPIDQVDKIAQNILAFEKELANHLLSKEDRRRPDKLYNPYTMNEFRELCPAIDLEMIFKTIGVASPDRFIVTEPEFFRFLNEYFQTISIEEISRYLTFLTIHHAAPFAYGTLEDAHFDLFNKLLEGTEQIKPRKERIVKIVNQFLGEAVGQLFVSKYFPESAKATALEMTGDIIEAFRNRINVLEWMTVDTKKYALEKLESFKVKIGYPDKWKEYDELELKLTSSGGYYLENILMTAAWKFKKDAERIGQKVDRDEWFMAPQVVNAYYNPMFNEIVFPAAILQPPFFDWQADAAVNYGGIGAVIGHEITHGFDDQGSRFDKEGNLSDWWKEDDRSRFQELTKQLVQQFDEYHPFEDLSLNGTFTLGENIADLGGLGVAYDALQLYYQRHGKPESIEGFSPDQRFFMSWATVWRTKIRPEALRHQIKTDPHPPGLYRAVAAPSNINSFYDAFNINQQSKWYRRPDDRIKIW